MHRESHRNYAIVIGFQTELMSSSKRIIETLELRKQSHQIQGLMLNRSTIQT